MVTFLEFYIENNKIQIFNKFNIKLNEEQILFNESLLNESFWDSTKNTLKKTGSFLKSAIDTPEKITAGIHKAYKVMKSTAFLAALVYIGFRFEDIRALFPWLVPVIDKMGAIVLGAGSDFLKMSFEWLKSISKEVVKWLVSVAKESVVDLQKTGTDLMKNMDPIDPNTMMPKKFNWGPHGKF